MTRSAAALVRALNSRSSIAVLHFGFWISDFGLGMPKSPNRAMNEQEFKTRTKQLALRLIALVDELPRRTTADVIGRQLVRSATSVGANYRSACRGKSTADVLAKLAIGEEEADETIYWLALLVEAKIVSNNRVTEIVKETNEIVAMTVASIKTLRGRK
jgi:four helix bundle protein